MLYGPSVRSRSAPQDAPSSHCYQGLFGCPDFESATGSSGWCSCSHNVARIRAAWCPLRPARSLRLRPSAGGGTWPWSRAACGRCGDALLVAAGRGSLATEELGGDVARHAADSLPSSTWLTQGHPRLGPGRPVRCARQAPERAGEAKRRPIPARLRLRPDQGGAAPPGNRQNKAEQPFGIAASINRPVTMATSMRQSSTCGACAWVQPVTSGAWDPPKILAAARSGIGAAISSEWPSTSSPLCRELRRPPLEIGYGLSLAAVLAAPRDHLTGYL